MKNTQEKKKYKINWREVTYYEAIVEANNPNEAEDEALNSNEQKMLTCKLIIKKPKELKKEVSADEIKK